MSAAARYCNPGPVFQSRHSGLALTGSQSKFHAVRSGIGDLTGVHEVAYL